MHLGEGFFPVGIKEYGGILYIVSSRAEATITANGVTIPVPEIYDPELSYSAGSYVSIAKKISIPDGNWWVYNYRAALILQSNGRH